MSNPSQQTNGASNVPPPMPPPVPVAQPLDYRSPNLRPVQGQSTVYEHVADKVGMVPSLRGSDNLISLLGLVIGGAIGGTGGMLMGGVSTAVAGGVACGFGGVVLVGLYLGIRNLFRK